VHNVELRAVTLGFGSGAARMTALNGVDLMLESGLFTVISGPSGSGKTSLISILGAMIAPDSGSVLFEDSDITKLSPDRRSVFRREKIGYIFQSFRLMPALDAEENIRLSLEIRRLDKSRQRALAALDIVGLTAKAHLRPDQMSHGEKQRVAVARAIAHGPVIVLADEPTASLDAANGAQVTQLLADIAQDNERIVAVVTHDPRILPVAQRIIRLEDGRIAGDQRCHA
jgi:putative ABC transport system ATP-binding protein